MLPGPSLVYCATRKSVERVTQALRERVNGGGLGVCQGGEEAAPVEHQRIPIAVEEGRHIDDAAAACGRLPVAGAAVFLHLAVEPIDAAGGGVGRMHTRASLDLHPLWQHNRQAYTHWVPQFTTYALACGATADLAFHQPMM